MRIVAGDHSKKLAASDQRCADRVTPQPAFRPLKIVQYALALRHYPVCGRPQSVAGNRDPPDDLVAYRNGLARPDEVQGLSHSGRSVVN